MRRHSILASLALAFTLTSALAAQAPRPATTSAAVVPVNIADDADVLGAERLFSAWMDGQMLYRDLPGVVVGVVADQQLVWVKPFGYADVKAKKPMAADTRFRMASHSKLFTATAIMQLREQGKVRLDDPVEKYLPWFKVKPAEENDGPITIEQLLTHQSGLPREAGAHWTTMEFPTPDELRALMPDRQAAFPPSTRWKYSNLAFTVAGMVVEQVSGQRWADYVTANIFRPLGMTQSSVDVNDPLLAVAYNRRMPDGTREVLPFVDARGMASATGITSTVGDMAKFVSAQFRTGKMGGSQILSTGSLREMHRVRSLDNNWTSGTAIGFGVTRVGDKVYIGHGGGYPGFTTQTLIQLENRVGVIVLTNTNDSQPADIARQLMISVGEAVAKASSREVIQAGQVAWDPSWSRFAGLYRGRGGDTQVVLLNNKLVVMTPNAPTLENVITLEPLGGGRFRLVAPTGGGPVGEVVRFIEEPGKPMRMITGDGYVDRVR